MSDTITLKEAQARREAALAEREIDRVIDERLGLLFSADDVTADDRAHLRGILKHYAKNPHPFRACVRDNMKRFGPGRTEKVCATLKDMIRGTTNWRHEDSGFAGSDSAPELTPEVERLLLSIPDEQLDSLMMEVSR